MTTTVSVPAIIQGGMGIAVSNWRLARAVSMQGALGVVSGTAIDAVLVRRLQDGDPDGDVRRAMATFPVPEVAEYVERRFFNEHGRLEGSPFLNLPMLRHNSSVLRQQILMLAAYVEVFLAREGHAGMVGMNLLTKIQLPTVPSLYGAMLAGVDVILMGAGIPREIPGVLDALALHDDCSIRLDVIGAAPGEQTRVEFSPRACFTNASAALKRPQFLPIVSASSLAATLARKSNGRVDGFIVEGPTAGGHNAPPRGTLQLDDAGQPVYGERDRVDLAAMRDIGLPFWLAGGVGSPDALRNAQSEGAMGIQVGTLFAFCDESGFTPEIKAKVVTDALRGELQVRTDARASPTGYPFKVIDTASSNASGPPRERICDLGYLRDAVRTAEGKLVYRCAAEPVEQYVKKGGAIEDTVKRQCLCNALSAGMGAPQLRDGGIIEPAIVTAGDDVQHLSRFLHGRTHYSARDVLGYLSPTLVPLAPHE